MGMTELCTCLSCVTTARVDCIVDRVVERLWVDLAASFPEATTGDLAPGVEDALVAAVRRAATAWTDANVPKEGA